MARYNNEIIKVIHKGFKVQKAIPPTNCALIFAYNGTGKTRLSMDFAHYNRKENQPPHTLYYNAYTEDLFTWNNGDIKGDKPETYLKIDTRPALIQGLKGIDIITPLVKYFQIFTDIEPTLLYDTEKEAELPYGVKFSRQIQVVKEDPENKDQNIKDPNTGEDQLFPEYVENIKISRGEERLFVWCFFRCIIDQVIGGNPAYQNIRYIYIDDPMSSLDDNNVIGFATQLYAVIRKEQKKNVEAYKNDSTKFPIGKEANYVKFIVSTHHALFFHTMSHGLCKDKSLHLYYLNRNRITNEMLLKNMDNSTPFYYNVAMMYELKQAIAKIDDKNNPKPLYTYHLTILRGIIERIRDFFGHSDYSKILDGMTYYKVKLQGEELTDFISRNMNVLTHQASMFELRELAPDNQELIIAIYNCLMEKYQFELPDLEDFRSENTIKNSK